MTTKTSTEKVSPHKTIGDDLNYNFVYNYDKNYAHRLVNVGNRYYKYDSNGNIILEQEGAFEENEEVVYRKVTEETEDVYSTDYGWGLFKEKESYSNGGTRYKRTYTWNEKNQLISSVDANYSTAYVYGQDGQRSNKYTANSETLYFNKMWTLHTDTGNAVKGGQYAKNIYLGETRIVTKLNSGIDPKYQEEYYKQYFYHSDHLGSANLISDYKGDEYQRLEYTPYGETWVEKTNNTNTEFLPYKFTGKEQDEETGLYYYGARYLDPKYSLWISTDPALGEYISGSNVGCGGIYNHVNFNLYHYAGNSPLKYTDPTGMWVDNGDGSFTAEEKDTLWDLSQKTGCSVDSFDYKGDPTKLQVGQKVSSENLVARYKIANTAKSYEGSELWNYDVAKDNFGKNSYKCNKFVYDVTTESNASIGTPNGNILKKLFGKTDCPPTAGQLGDKNYDIDNWTPLTEGEIPMPGDIISEAHNYSDATGHTGIITGDKQTASSNASKKGKITINDWGFREDSYPLIRRYRGK